VNSTIALEGVVCFLKALSRSELDHRAIGCYDRDPVRKQPRFSFAHGVRQDVEGLLGVAFRIIDSRSLAHRRIVEIKPRLVWLHETGSWVGRRSHAGVP
jgi:hypothetical protein